MRCSLIVARNLWRALSYGVFGKKRLAALAMPMLLLKALPQDQTLLLLGSKFMARMPT
jgi:hypothetical protein